MKKTFLLALAMLLLTNCQDDDPEVANDPQMEEDPQVEEKMIPSKVSVISKDDEAVYQIDVDVKDKRIAEYNLTAMYNIETNYRSKYHNGLQVSFLYMKIPKYTSIIKDLSTQSSQSFSFDTASEEFEYYEGPDFPIDIADWSLLFTAKGDGEFRELAVHAIDHQTGEHKKIRFGQGVRTYWTVASKGDIILVEFQNEERRRIMARIDLASGDVSTKDFGETYFAALNTNQLHVFECSSGMYEVYDIRDWSVIESRASNCSAQLNWRPGLNTVQFHESEILVHIQLPQPSPDPTSPGIYDLETETFVESQVIITSLRYELQNLHPESGISVETYAVDLKSRNIVAGYKELFGSGGEAGGLVFTNFSGEILKDIPLDRVPDEIIITQP